MASGAAQQRTANGVRSNSGPRNSYVDALRTLAIVFVVLGHWIVITVVYRNGEFGGVDALGVISWASWPTLLLQVVPIFFLVGGYANAASWNAHQPDAERWSMWVRRRVLGLLAPTCTYVGVIAAAVIGCQLAGVDATTLREAGWALGLHLWFLAVYILVLLSTPLLLAAHRRVGLAVPLLLSFAAVVVDVGVVEERWNLVGWVNYLLVWGAFHQLGFAWYDGTFGTSGAASAASTAPRERTWTARQRPAWLATFAIIALTLAIWWGPYPVSMVGVPGARIQNPSPPSTALLAFGLVQSGIAVAYTPPAVRWLHQHPASNHALRRSGALTMPVYLWHMVPVVLVAVIAYARARHRDLGGWTGTPRDRRIRARCRIGLVPLALLAAGLLAVVASNRGKRGEVQGRSPMTVVYGMSHRSAASKWMRPRSAGGVRAVRP